MCLTTDLEETIRQAPSLSVQIYLYHIETPGLVINYGKGGYTTGKSWV